jgi:phosphoribosylanthranilate isomerase
MSSSNDKTQLRALGFCGADDSVHPNMLAMMARSFPFVEFGVLFRPDKEGQPRYASVTWVKRLQAVAQKSEPRMKLAAHFCESRVNEVLRGDDSFLKTLRGTFQRVQINATAVNGVDMSCIEDDKIADTLKAFVSLIHRNRDHFEFILQKNEETKPLWNGLLQMESDEAGPAGSLPKNVSMLVDESKGTGEVSLTPWPSPPDNYPIGYAGGIGPHNIEKVLSDVIKAGNGKSVWIDMESKLRSIKNGKDVFDLDKCYEVIDAVCATSLHSLPSYLT